MGDIVFGVALGLVLSLFITMFFAISGEPKSKCEMDNNVYRCEWVRGYWKPVKDH